MTRSKPISAATGSAKRVKPPETRTRSRPTRAHRADQRHRARHQPDALGEAAFDHRLVQALEQRDARVERGFEIELAAHRALGDRGDLRLDAGIVGELVDAFDGDHRRIHVGDEQRLARGPAPAGRPRRSPGTRPPARPAPHRARGRTSISARIALVEPALRRGQRTPPRRARSRGGGNIAPRSGCPAAISVAMNMASPSPSGGAHCRADRQRQVRAGARARRTRMTAW